MTREEYLIQKEQMRQEEQQRKLEELKQIEQTTPNKIMHYIQPISPFPYKEIIDWLILKVEVIKPGINDIQMCKILEVIREESGNGYYSFSKKMNELVGCKEEFLFPIKNKFNKEKSNE